MNSYEQVLVAILSTALAVFLLLGIVFLVLLIKLTKTVRRITDKAERLADKAGAVGDFFEHAAGPLAVGRALAAVAEKFFNKQQSKRKD